MSEIKGQILGVVLVLAIFGAIGTVLVTAFTDNAKSVAKKISTDSTPTYNADSLKDTAGTPTNLNNQNLSNLELLTF